MCVLLLLFCVCVCVCFCLFCFLVFFIIIFNLPNHTSQGTNPDYSYMSRMFQQKYIVGRFTLYMGQRALVDGAKSQYLSRNKKHIVLIIMSRIFQQKEVIGRFTPYEGLGRRGKKPIPLKEQNQLTLICQECSNKKSDWSLYPMQRALADGAKSQQGRFAPNVRRNSTGTKHEGQLQRIVQKGSTFLSREQRKN